ncbi:Lactaldehyde dehydrogenase involved in frucose or rhamnose utilization [Streptococcus infantarius subsp. infantarius]|nr:Lactaldehyde dehydrogenase involved in frucose or rhamnose utilization [Streptococcus infantarius subsp. infantarius]
MSVFYVPSQNLIGRGVVKEIGSHIKELGYKKGSFGNRSFYCWK